MNWKFIFGAAVLFASIASAQPYCGNSYGPGVMGFLTPEQRMMHFSQVQQATEKMSFDGTRDYRWNLRTKVMAMSPAERQKFADDLSTQWNALSTDEKKKIESSFFTYRGNGQGGGRGMGRGRGWRMGPGCWW